MKKGFVHIYTGDGKGKTTAAIGLAVRASGCGYDAQVFQFCKNTPSGELNALAKLPHISVIRADYENQKFTWDMTPEEKQAFLDAQQALFDEACEAAQNPDVDLVVLDEILAAMQEGAVNEDEIRYLMKHKYHGTELVLTGRGATKPLIDAADYVTEMRMIKHPFEQGVDARRGIEF